MHSLPCRQGGSSGSSQSEEPDKGWRRVTRYKGETIASPFGVSREVTGQEMASTDNGYRS